MLFLEKFWQIIIANIQNMVQFQIRQQMIVKITIVKQARLAFVPLDINLIPVIIMQDFPLRHGDVIIKCILVLVFVQK